MRRSPTAKFFFFLPVLVVLSALLSGCVYIRLLKFKHQLKDFTEYVEVDKRDGLSLNLKKPILLSSDFVFITGSQPTSKQSEKNRPNVSTWTWKFEKQKPHESEPIFNLLFRTRFENELLTRIEFDRTLATTIAPEFFVSVIRSMSQAKINHLRRTATSEIRGESIPQIPLPTMNQILQAMGKPTFISDDGKTNTLSCEYIFNFNNPNNGERAGQFKVVFKTNAQSKDEAIEGFLLSGKGR